MIIATTYDNGNIFQHFGKAESFKLYTIENAVVKSSEVAQTGTTGHSEVAAFLAGNNVDIVICGGIGEHAADALEAVGIQVYSGVEGNTDEAVSALLAGELESAGVNCSHHDHDHDEEGGCGCGDSCGSSCGGGCGGCCGGGTPEPLYEGPNAGKTVRVHYTGTFNDGTKFDSSVDRGEPMEFVCGVGMMIPGFDKAVADMEVGQTIDIHLEPAEAYGEPNPMAILTVDVNELPGSAELNIGDHVYLSDQAGRPIPAHVTAREGDMITFDANHEMAGKELNFTIELVEVK